MNQLLMLFALPIGVLFFIIDRRQQETNRKIAEAFIDEVRANDGLSPEAKLGHIKKMFELNRFAVEYKGENHLVATRKHLNLGAAILSFALVPLYIGVLLFVLWFIFLKKPERWEVTPADTTPPGGRRHSISSPA